MAKHDVSFEVPARPLVKADGQVIGTLAVSSGSVVWFPRGTTYGCKMGWRKFNTMMDQKATRQEKR